MELYEQYKQYEELGSIMKYLYENHDKKSELNIYLEEVPKNFKEPCIYLPTPLFSSNNESFGSFKNSYTWLVKLFDKKTSDAQKSAMQIVNKLAGEKYYIELFDFDNNPLNKFIRINSAETRKIEEGVIQIELKFDLSYEFFTQDYTKFTKFYLKEV